MLAYFMQKYRLGEFAKVNRISTIDISPDIDLLDVNVSQKIVTGYEFKLLRYRKSWKRVDFASMYKGIGQALSYFQFGVDKSYLILGVSKEIPTRLVSSTIRKIEETIAIFNILKVFINEKIEEFAEEIGRLIGVFEEVKVMAKHIQVFGRSAQANWESAMEKVRVVRTEKEVCGLGCLGIMTLTEHDDLLVTRLSADEVFPVNFYEDLKHKKECLLRKEFRHDKHFLERYKASKHAENLKTNQKNHNNR